MNATVTNEVTEAPPPPPEWEDAVTGVLVAITVVIIAAGLYAARYYWRRIKAHTPARDLPEAHAALMESHPSPSPPPPPVVYHKGVRLQPFAPHDDTALQSALKHLAVPTGCPPSVWTPRGGGAVVVGSHGAAALDRVEEIIMKLWCNKQGDLLDELTSNLVVPERFEGLNIHVLLREVSEGVAKVGGDESPSALSPLMLLATALYSHEGPDTDRLLLFEDAPVWVPGNTASRRAWEEYKEQHSRNTCLREEIDASLQAFLTGGARETRQTTAALSKWVKVVALLWCVASPRKESVVYKLSSQLPPSTTSELRVGGDAYWAAPQLASTRRPKGDGVLVRVKGAPSIHLGKVGQYAGENAVIVSPCLHLQLDGVREEGKHPVFDYHVLPRAERCSFRRRVLDEAWNAQYRLARIVPMLTVLALGQPVPATLWITWGDGVRRFVRQDRECQGLPTWQDTLGTMLLSHNGRWVIATDTRKRMRVHAASLTPHRGAMPHSIASWGVPDTRPGKWLTAPLLSVTAVAPSVARLPLIDAEPLPQAPQEPDGLPDEPVAAGDTVALEAQKALLQGRWVTSTGSVGEVVNDAVTFYSPDGTPLATAHLQVSRGRVELQGHPLSSCDRNRVTWADGDSWMRSLRKSPLPPEGGVQRSMSPVRSHHQGRSVSPVRPSDDFFARVM